MPITLPGDGTPISQNTLNSFFAQSSTVNLPAGTYCFPTTFQYNFGAANVTLTGLKGKTVITTYDNTPQTNFAIPLKIDITKAKPADGVYQIDIIGNQLTRETVHSDFSHIPPVLDSYVQISERVVSTISFAGVKALGYVTELDTTSPEPGIDGIYVVTKHYFIESYGGGNTHFNLRYVNGVSGTLSDFNTNSLSVWFIQGTILKRESGIWSRHYTGAGFATTGNLIVRNIFFDNVQFYLFSPFDIVSTSQLRSSSFEISNCVFRNVGRVISSMSYGGINQSANWYVASNVYNVSGVMRFDDFRIVNNTFSSIHTSISWGTPPATNVDISNNVIRDCYSIFTCFNLFITNIISANAHTSVVTQNISNNNFINIRILDGPNWTTSIMRTSGVATVNNNQFSNVSQQACYFSGGDSTFLNNLVSIENKPNQSFVTPVILSKTGIYEVLFEENTIIAPFSTIVAIEGKQSITLSKNKIFGCSKYRYLTTKTTSINREKTYLIRNINKFNLLTKGAVSGTVLTNQWVYFNKRKKMWERAVTMPNTYLFAKVDENNNIDQTLTITNNLIEVENLLNISSSTQTVYKSIKISGNTIDEVNLLSTVKQQAVIQSLVVSNNIIKGNFVMFSTTIGLVNSLVFESNRIEKVINSQTSLAAANLTFKKNTFVEDKRFASTEIFNTDFGLTLATYLNAVTLTTGNLGALIIDSNRIILSQSRVTCLRIENANDVTLTNNIFTLQIPSYQTTSSYLDRIAVSSLNSGVELPENNIVVPEPGKTNTSLQIV